MHNRQEFQWLGPIRLIKFAGLKRVITSQVNPLYKQIYPYLSPHLKPLLTPNISPEDALSMAIHLNIVHNNLSTYLPHYTVDLIHINPTPGHSTGQFKQATLLFADISGFTAMSEKLSQRGREGAEEITRIVNDYFNTMLDISNQYQGDLLKFGGDALLFAFFDTCGPQHAVIAAKKMQEAMAQFKHIETVHDIFSLQMSIGIGTGRIFLARIGSAEQMQLVIMGATLSRMAQAEALAEATEIMVDENSRLATAHAVDYVACGNSFWLLKQITQVIPPPKVEDTLVQHSAFETLADIWDDPIQILERCGPHIELIEGLRSFLPLDLFTKAVINTARYSDLWGAHRPVTVMFANFLGLDELIEDLGPAQTDKITAILNNHFQTMHRIIIKHGGMVNMIDSYLVGHRIMAVFGALRAHEDDPQRAARAALEMNEALRQVNQQATEILSLDLALSPNTVLLTQRIGLNTGFVFAGNLGGHRRREYAVMGDEVNLTARLMSLAHPNQILISQNTAKRIEKDFILIENAPVRVKGKSKPIPNFVIQQEKQKVFGQKRVAVAPLIGREAELHLGQELIDLAWASEGQVLLVSGVSGIGKTRLTEEIERYARLLDFEVLGGDCFSYTKDMAYYPWQNIWRSYFNIHAEPTEYIEQDKLSGAEKRKKQEEHILGRQNKLRQGMAALKAEEWTPIIADVLGLNIPDNNLTKQLDAKLRQQRLFDLTLDMLRSRSRQHPILLIIEDAHWADPASVALMIYIARNISHHHILFLVLHRLDTDLPSKLQFPHTHSIILPELTLPACLELAQHILKTRKIPSALQNIILQKSSGSPHFVEEVIRSLVEQEMLYKTTTGDWLTHPDINKFELPEKVQGIIISRIDRLDEFDRQILQVASVIGREFAYQVLAGIYEADDLNGQLRERLTYLDDTGLTELLSQLSERYRFRHISTHEVIYEGQSFERRRSLHRKIGRFMEETYADSLDEYLSILAYHFFVGRSWAKALLYNRQTAQKAQHDYANEAAIVAYQRALTAAQSLAGDTHQQEVTIHEGLGDVLTLVGRYEEALEHFEQVHNLIENDPALSGFEINRRLADLCRKRAATYEYQSDFITAFEWLNNGLGYLDEAGPSVELARIYVRGAVTYDRQGKFEKAIEWVKQGLDIAKKINSLEGKRTVAHANYVLGGILSLKGEYAQAIQLYENSVQIYKRLDDLMGKSAANLNLAITYYDKGDWEKSLPLMLQTQTLKEKIGDIFSIAALKNNLGLLYRDRGDWAEAHQVFNASLEIFQQLGAIWAEATVLMNLAQTHIYQQAYTSAQNLLNTCQTLFTDIASSAFAAEIERLWATFHFGQENFDLAVQHSQESINYALEQELRLDEGISRRILGEIYLAQNKLTMAETELSQSLDILTLLESAYEGAKSKLSLSKLYLKQGQPHKTQQYLQEAITVFNQLGAKADLTQAQKIEAQF